MGESNFTPLKRKRKGGQLKVVILSVVIIALGALSWYFFIPKALGPRDNLATYFSYSDDDLRLVRGGSSMQQIAEDNIYDWEDKAFELVGKSKLNDAESSNIYTYLFLAQREFAFLSHNITGSYDGSLDYISSQTLCKFFTKDCRTFSKDAPDEFTKSVSDIILKNISERMEEDQYVAQPYSIKEGEQYWTYKEPVVGRSTGARKTWLLVGGDQFRVPPLPYEHGSAGEAEQLNAVKQALAQITDKQKRDTVFWAGGPGTKTPPGIWIQLMSDYQKVKKPRIEKLLLDRSLLAMTIADAVTAVYDSKWTHMAKRPYMLDSSIITVMPTPNHPSYPAGHSTISHAASTMLGYLYPENRKKWDELALEAGRSRVWGGIHFPIDDELGTALGVNIANFVIGLYR